MKVRQDDPLKSDKDKKDKQLEELRREAEEWRNKYLRALADYQNLERRTQEGVVDIRKFASSVLLTRFLPVVDTFEKANSHLQDAGLALAMKQLSALLEEQNVQKIDVVGKQFNPQEMECVEVVEGKDNEVVEEVLPGYKLHGKVLRVAKVKVGKQDRDEKAQEQAKKEAQKGDYM